MNSFQQVKQNPGEPVDSFHMRVCEKLMPLEWDKMTKEDIIELVNHCTISTVRKKALKDGLSLKGFLKNARAHERAEKQSNEIEDSGNNSQRAVQGKKNYMQRRRSLSRRRSQHNEQSDVQEYS